MENMYIEMDAETREQVQQLVDVVSCSVEAALQGGSGISELTNQLEKLETRIVDKVEIIRTSQLLQETGQKVAEQSLAELKSRLNIFEKALKDLGEQQQSSTSELAEHLGKLGTTIVGKVENIRTSQLLQEAGQKVTEQSLTELKSHLITFEKALRNLGEQQQSMMDAQKEIQRQIDQYNRPWWRKIFFRRDS